MKETPVILGMHKSGTSLLSRLIHDAGVNMVDETSLDSYDEGNHYERQSILDLNSEILGDDGKLSIDVLQQVSMGSLSEGLVDKLEDLVSELDKGYQKWGFKDPRTILVVDIWLSVIDCPVLIVIFRDPVAVFNHYKKYCRYPILDFFYLYRALKAWCIYNQLLIKKLDKHKSKQAILIEYDQLMSGSDYDRLKAYLGGEFVDARDVKQNRSKKSEDFFYKVARLFVICTKGLDCKKIYSSLLVLRQNSLTE